ncbi:MAG: arginine repressor [Firmicutes bacterium]|nr:arginine repressor [Bacillota bacterium]
MRHDRQGRIKELIAAYDIDTQEKLVELLNADGYRVTQATVSRDIKNLKLVKTLASNGKYKYTVEKTPEQSLSERFIKILKECVLSVKSSGNIIVIQTLSGCANAAAEAIDTSNFPMILGSIAGDKTIFLVVDYPEKTPDLVELFNDLLK